MCLSFLVRIKNMKEKEVQKLEFSNTEYAKLVAPYKKAALDTLSKLISINTVFDKETNSNAMPFGKGVNDALTYIANLGYSLGFSVDRCDNYATELSVGVGRKVLDIYAHVDVVDVNREKWTKDPFKMTIENNCIYGRGAADDKGPAVACLFAVKALYDVSKIKGYKLRFIFGGNEETGSLCLKHYFRDLKKEYPTVGFSPDADYPLIYAEKSMCSYKQTYDVALPFISSFKAGNALNVVLDTCSTKMKFKDEREEEKLKKKLASYTKKVEGLTATCEDSVLTFKGVAAHGSTPYNGVNAGLHMLNFLGKFYHVGLLKYIFKCYNDGHCKKLGLNFKDKVFNESTYNVGKIEFSTRSLTLYVNSRYPSSLQTGDVFYKIHKAFSCPTVLLSSSDGFVAEQNSPLITTLLQSYRDETNDSISMPLAIGGGTYARESKNTVAFGAQFPNTDYKMHGDDEFFPLEDFYGNMQIYAHAIDKLGDYLRSLPEDNETTSQKVDR